MPRMKKWLLAVGSFPFFLPAQSSFYLVYFTAKPDSFLWKPEQCLSSFTLQQRLQLGIPIDIYDVPIPSAWIDSLSHYGKIWGVSRWLNAALIEVPAGGRLPTGGYIHCVVPFVRVRPAIGVSSLSSFRGAKVSPKVTVPVNALQLDQLKLSSLHDLGYTGQGIRVAILDAGFPYMDQIPAFQRVFREGRYLGGYDFVAGDSTVFGDNSHGTQVASVIVGYDDSVGYIGGAPGVSVLLARTENALSESRIEEWNWARAAEWVDSIGVHIIQSSLGYSTFDDPAENYTYPDMNGHTAITTQAALLAARKGILVVTSAGNEGNTSWRYITAPADADSVLAVGAIGSSGQLAPFSSRGPTTDGRIKPDVVALGWGTYVIGLSGQPQQASGTSFSAPLITSLAACLWQAFPTASAQEIRQAILASADRYASPDTLYGYGLPNGERALVRLTALHRPFPTADLRLYPNPAAERLFLFLPDTTLGYYTLRIYDAEGRAVFQCPYRGHTELAISLSGWRPGIYFAEVRQEATGKTLTKAFIRL
ncbi:MAG: peptidase S8 [Bacteroidia bacterium]|nr:MAG: peptidase S8 [Bacteroidia bacterium]